MSNPAAWHPDPVGRHEYRYWDGERWTDHVADAGQVSSDPLDGGTGGAGSTDAGATDAGTSPGRTGETGAAAGPSDADRSPTEATPGSSAGTEASSGWADGGAPADRDATAGHDAGTSPDATGGTGAAAGGAWQQPDTGGSPTSEPSGQAWGGHQHPQDPPTWQGSGGDWQQAPSTGAAPSQASNGMAIAALIVGILSLLVAFIPFIGLISVIGGIVAAVLGFIARKKAKRGEASGGGMALGGIITGLIAIVLPIVITVALVSFGGNLFGESFSSFEECVDEGRPVEECEDEFERDLMEQFGVEQPGAEPVA